MLSAHAEGGQVRRTTEMGGEAQVPHTEAGGKGWVHVIILSRCHHLLGHFEDYNENDGQLHTGP